MLRQNTVAEKLMKINCWNFATLKAILKMIQTESGRLNRPAICSHIAGFALQNGTSQSFKTGATTVVTPKRHGSAERSTQLNITEEQNPQYKKDGNLTTLTISSPLRRQAPYSVRRATPLFLSPNFLLFNDVSFLKFLPIKKLRRAHIFKISSS